MSTEPMHGWPGLSQYDAYWCQRRLPDPVRALLKDTTVRLTLAGGYIRSCITGDEVNDIDLFSTSKEVASLAAQKLAGSYKPFRTENAFTVKLPNCPPVQFIHRWTFAKPEEVIPSFDFTIARAAMWWEPDGTGRWRSLCDPRFYADLAGKRLIYQCPIRNEDAGGSLLRVLKFYQRGYRIPLDSLGAVIARLVARVRADEIEGGFSNEVESAKILTGLLREVDPSIDPSHLPHIPGADDEAEVPQQQESEG